MQASSGTVGPQAVCFSAEDYAGFWRRVAVELVDLFTAGIILIAVTTIIVLAAPANAQSGGVFLVCWAASIYWYFVIVKHSRFNTLGYRLARVRIVDVYGRPPSLSALSLRLLFAVVGPFNIASRLTEKKRRAEQYRTPKTKQRADISLDDGTLGSNPTGRKTASRRLSPIV